MQVLLPGEEQVKISTEREPAGDFCRFSLSVQAGHMYLIYAYAEMEVRNGIFFRWVQRA